MPGLQSLCNFIRSKCPVMRNDHMLAPPATSRIARPCSYMNMIIEAIADRKRLRGDRIRTEPPSVSSQSSLAMLLRAPVRKLEASLPRKRFGVLAPGERRSDAALLVVGR